MVVYPLQQRKMRKRTTQAQEGTRRGSGIQNDKLTEGCVYEDLVHEFMIPPVARQGKGPSRYMLELLRRVLFVMPLWGLQLPLCDDEGSAMNKKNRAVTFACDATHLRGVHAATALALATTLERLHLAILLRDHRLCIRSPTHAHTHARTDPRTSANAHAYVRRHAANGT